MKRSTVLGVIAGLIVGLIIGVFVLSPGSDSSKPASQNVATSDVENIEPVRWKMASSYSGNLILLGTQGHFVEKRIRTLSN